MASQPFTWIPHPFPHPSVPYTLFWAENGVFAPSLPALPPFPQDPQSAAYLTGGWYLPAVYPIGGWSIPVEYSPGTWPPIAWPFDVPIKLSPWLIPNPFNVNLPQITWDVSTHPSTAYRLTGAHVTAPLSGRDGIKGIWKDSVTTPGFETILVVCNIGMMAELWGAIAITRKKSLSIEDLFHEIYNFFQIPLSPPEVERICAAKPDNMQSLQAAFGKRIAAQPGATHNEWRMGLKRVDCLGDRRWWWGVWITYNWNKTWQLNLGLINPAGRL